MSQASLRALTEAKNAKPASQMATMLDTFKIRSEIEAIRSLAQLNAAALDAFFWLKAKPQVRDSDGGTSFSLCKAGAKTQQNSDPKQDIRVANIVLQGGGVLGLAHTGFVAGLEHANVRFAGVAGASAGAIMAMGMVAVRGESFLNPTHEKLIEIMTTMPMETFIDGPHNVRWLIKQYLLKRSLLRPTALPAIFSAIRMILKRRGLNPGTAFEDWLDGTLKDHGLATVEDLLVRLVSQAKELKAASEASADVQNFFQQQTKEAEIGDSLLQIMAACTSLGVKFQFPHDARYLKSTVMQRSPAQLVRASMSIPLFFEPKRFDVNPTRWQEFIGLRVKNLIDKDQEKDFLALDEVVFLDGGIFSNLPADAFREVMPDVPAIIVPLVSVKSDRPFRRSARISSFLEDFVTIGFMVRNQRDHDAIAQLERSSQRYHHRLPNKKPSKLPPTRMAPINVGEANWLNFVMEEQAMAELFLKGLQQAHMFLQKIIDDAQVAR
jgi:NTE family protein